MKLIQSVFFCLLLMGSISSFAETGAIPGTQPLPGPIQTPTLGTMDKPVPLHVPDMAFANKVFSIFANPNVMYSSAFDKAKQLTDPAKSTWAALTFLAFAWMGIRVTLEGSPHKVMSELIATILKSGIVFFMLDQYNMIGQAVTSSMTMLVGLVGPNSGAQASALAAADAMYQTASALWNGIKILTVDPGDWMNDVFYLIGGIAMIVAAALYVLMFFLGDLIASLCIALGPIFIAFAVLDATMGFFENWTKTLLTGLGYKVVAAGIVFLTADVFTNKLTGQGASSDAAIAAAIMGIATVYVMIQVPQLASSLFGAGFRVGGDVAEKAALGAKSASKSAGGKLYNASVGKVVNAIKSSIKGG